MKSLKNIVAIATSLVLVLSPMLQVSQLAATAPTKDTGDPMPSCCCATEAANAEKPDLPDHTCSCTMSESPAPLEMPPASHEVQDTRSLVFDSAPVTINEADDFGEPNRSLLSFRTNTGKSPPVYLLSCSFLI